MKKEKIKELIKSIVKLFKSIKDINNKTLSQKESVEILPESIKDAKPSIEDNEVKENNGVNFPIFEIGIPNLAKDDNTIKVRKFIDYEFGLDFKTDWLQCTEYVQYKVLKELEVRIDWTGRVGSRNGGDWPSQFIRLKRYRVLDTPKRGCAMSFANPNFNKPWGHISFVEEASDNDKSIKISEANWPSKGIYNKRSLSKGQWSQEKLGAKFIDFT